MGRFCAYRNLNAAKPRFVIGSNVRATLFVALASFLPFVQGYANAPPQCCEKNIKITPSIAPHALPQEPVQSEEHLRDFHPDMLYLVDQRQNVFLFRGNLPESKKVFCYDDLTNAVKKYLLEQGIHIKDDFKIMDLSFLNYITEYDQIEAEKDWLSKHPKQGCFWLNSLYGSLVNPIDLPEVVRNSIVRHHDVDGLKKLMSHLKKIMDESHSSDFVIYIHCHAGKDRTGEASASYLMQYKGFSYKEAIALDQKIAKRELSSFSMNAIRWYAFYLRDVKNMAWIGNIDGK